MPGTAVVRSVITNYTIYDSFINEIIILKNFSKKTAIPENITHYSLLRKIHWNYYFNYKAAVYNWWRQNLPYDLNVRKHGFSLKLEATSKLLFCGDAIYVMLTLFACFKRITRKKAKEDFFKSWPLVIKTMWRKKILFAKRQNPLASKKCSKKGISSSCERKSF